MIISGLQGQVESSWLQAENGGGGVPNRYQAEKSGWGTLGPAWQTQPPDLDPGSPGALAVPPPLHLLWG